MKIKPLKCKISLYPRVLKSKRECKSKLCKNNDLDFVRTDEKRNKNQIMRLLNSLGKN